MTLPVAVIGSASRYRSRAGTRGRQPVADEGLELGRQRGRGRDARRRHDERLDDLGPDGSGMPTTAAIADGRVAEQAILDLARPDPVAAAGDEVVVAGLVPEIAVGVDAARSPVRSQSPANLARVASGRFQ